MKRFLMLTCVAVAMGSVVSCGKRFGDTDIRDHPLLDRRVEETPRQKVLRECRQEADKFRVSCAYCHTSPSEADITQKDLKLTHKGRVAKIMRHSPTFGMHQQCGKCHQSKFQLNQSAKKWFGPSGSRRREIEKALESTPVK